MPVLAQIITFAAHLFFSLSERCKMKKAFAAFLIAIVCLAVIVSHAWLTCGETDMLGSGITQKERELFEYSLFLESFAFMLSTAYWTGPRIYRVFREEAAALSFEGEKEKVSRTVHVYAAICVVFRRLTLDRKMGVGAFETAVAIALISAPAVWALVRKKVHAKKRIAYLA